MEGQQNIVLWGMFAAGMACMVILIAIVFFIRRAAYLHPVKKELKKEKQWLRRGEYNAAMVKGRQNLELLFKLVAGNNGIQLDNTAQAVANARNAQERGGQGDRKRRTGKSRVMTHQQFGWWLEDNGYLDRVAKWEINEVRLIGNKAVHENFASKEDAWNQYNYLEDILKTISEARPALGRRKSTKKTQGKKKNPGSPAESGASNGGRKQEKTKSQNGQEKAKQSQKPGNPPGQGQKKAQPPVKDQPKANQKKKQKQNQKPENPASQGQEKAKQNQKPGNPPGQGQKKAQPPAKDQPKANQKKKQKQNQKPENPPGQGQKKAQPPAKDQPKANQKQNQNQNQNQNQSQNQSQQPIGGQSGQEKKEGGTAKRRRRRRPGKKKTGSQAVPERNDESL